MLKALSLFISILFLLSSCKVQEINKSSTDSTKWVSLFNGKNLEGWTIRILGKELDENYANTFRVEDGILKIRYDQYAGYDGQFGAIYYNKPYTNYRLKLDYRFIGESPADGAPSWGYKDSGIQFHSQSPQSMQTAQPFPVCLEYNLKGGDGTDERPTGEICVPGISVQIEGVQNASFCSPPQISRTFHGDQWVTMEIDVQNDVISHYANGEKILTYTNPRYDADHEVGKTFIKEGNDRVTTGYISLQSNSHPIDFRNIEVLEY